MRLAVPVWNHRIAPLFETTEHFFLLSMTGETSGSIKRELVCLSGMSLSERFQLLHAWRVTTVICGGITEGSLLRLNQMSVEVFPFLCGDVEEVCGAFFLGLPLKDRFSMPGQDKKEALT
jgi:predicted Fe-Mo cluster-binding NifX family protein